MAKYGIDNPIKTGLPPKLELAGDYDPFWQDYDLPEHAWAFPDGKRPAPGTIPPRPPWDTPDDEDDEEPVSEAFNPNQLRHPTGGPEGGQIAPTSGGVGGGRAGAESLDPPGGEQIQLGFSWRPKEASLRDVDMDTRDGNMDDDLDASITGWVTGVTS